MDNQNIETNKKYWFFGSKLNTGLLLILIVLMVIALRFMMRDRERYFPKSDTDAAPSGQTTTINNPNGPDYTPAQQ